MAVFSFLFALSALFSFAVGIPHKLLERDVPIPSVINNCSGTVQPALPDHIASAPGYAPQLPSQGSGWEEWLMVADAFMFNGSEIQLFLARWSRGDPASQDSRLENGRFTFSASFNNGTIWEYSVDGPVIYNEVGDMKLWAVGDNRFTFDGTTTGTWGYSMTQPGFSFQSQTEMYVRVHIPVSF